MSRNILDDENMLESSLRKANPFPNDKTPELDERALRDLAAILGDNYSSTVPETEPASGNPLPETTNVVQLQGRSRKSTHTRRWVLGAVAAVAAGILVAGPLGSSLNGAGKAVASPLALTNIKPATMSTEEAIAALLEAAEQHPDPANFNPGHLKVEHWEENSLFIPDKEQTSEPFYPEDGSEPITMIQGTSDERVSIPTVSETLREKDLSGNTTITVGDPYSTTGEDVKFVPAVGNQIPGSVETLKFKAGEMQLWFKKEPSKDPSQLFKQIQKFQKSNNAAVGDGSEGFIQSVGFMLTDWKLSQAQSKALLQTLLMVENVEYLGTATDRWERKTMVFGVKTPTDSGTNQTMLMFNPDTGRPIDYAQEFTVDRDFTLQSFNKHDYVMRYLAFSE
ncbi:hypothetical protein CQ018_02680 [Arthrobacter sp. MYb227]|uniref:hypothetical protein n=1 Tax=Arthrobacter sp. MYb227 TaxID=1848601 RepID=UPI000CFDB1C9|nr:hypothetical protein [Arthrobacter sp. MYb227]PQZ96201.1 hypothetical protein CQ018_02680 [Arthrobacter sp. MYb227]